MKFLEIFRHEFAYQVRRPWPWLFVVVLLVLNFLMTRDGSLSAVLYSDFFLNSPFSVAKTTVFGSLIWLVMAAAIAGDAAARDVETGMYALIYTVPVSKAQYLGGRFLAALVLNALILLAVQVGILLGVYLPGVDATLIGPFRPAVFLTSYAFISLPNAFAATAIQFSLAARSGRAMAGYFGSFLIVFIGFFIASLLLYNSGLGTMLDPIGIRFVVEDIAYLWTPVEKNWRLLGLEGILLKNRLLWLGIGLATLAVLYLSFRFAHRRESSWWSSIRRFIPLQRKARMTAAQSPRATINKAANTPIAIIKVPQVFGMVLHLRQIGAIAWVSFRIIAISWAGLAMLVFIPLLTIPVVLDQMVSNGVPMIPVTPQVITELTGSMADELSRWVIIPFLLIFFAGELVWREREAGLGEITDAMPGSEWAAFLGKFLGLGLVLLLFMALLTTAGMLAQLIMNNQQFELGLYLKTMFGLQLTDYLLFALLALVVHVVVDQKYIGHLVAIITYVFIALASLFGVEHNMLIYGAGPAWSYTDMRGFGPSLEPWLWFRGYWAAWGLLLAVLASLFWSRGKERGLGVRLRLARRRLVHSTAWTAVVAVVLIIMLGGFIFYNTNILNEYLSASEKKERAAEYERHYGAYADIPQPVVTATKLNIDIYPRQRTANIHGIYKLENISHVTIDSIHLATVPGLGPLKLTLSRSAALVLADDDLHHQIYALEEPLQPGDSLQLKFQMLVKPRGFHESGVDASVVANGTNFTNAWLPAIGYQESRELIIASDRRDYGLTTRPVIASLYDVEARKKHGRGSTLETVISTDQDQIAIAPGILRKTWTEENRRYFNYSTNGPFGNTGDFFSASYAVHEVQWKATIADTTGQEVNIKIYHHPEHTAHLDRMVRSIKASLDYYTREFGPYRNSQLTIIERPGLGTGMHAEAATITHAEGFTTWNPLDDPGSHDHLFAVVAHEMAHQWTVPYANVEGAPVMSESLAWYYGIKAVENAMGPQHLKNLLNFMRRPSPYPPIRRGEPLLRGLDPYLSYRRGPFALYALSEYVGDNQVNSALRRLRENHSRNEAPLATTLDLYRELQAVTPDSLQYLLHDLFEVNTFWELKTESAIAEQIDDKTWLVTLDVQAKKNVSDSAGVETPVIMNDWVEIGIFAPAEGGKAVEPLYLQKHLIHNGKQTIKVTVPGKPAGAGIDPRHLLIDLDLENNRSDVELKN